MLWFLIIFSRSPFADCSLHHPDSHDLPCQLTTGMATGRHLTSSADHMNITQVQMQNVGTLSDIASCNCSHDHPFIEYDYQLASEKMINSTHYTYVQIVDYMANSNI